MDTRVLSDLNLTSKDCKTLVPALVNFLQNFERKFDGIFSEMKEDFQRKIKERDDRIQTLEGDVKFLKDKVKKMDKLADEADAYERRDTLIFSGPAIPEVSSNENCASILQEVIKRELKVNIAATDINTAHRLGPKPSAQGPDKRGIILKLCSRDLKRNIMMASKNQARPVRIYANESLTPPRRKIFNTLRFMKRQHPELVKGVSSFEGRVFAYTPNDSPAANSTRDRRHLVNDHDMLVKFCREFVKKPIETFLDSWQF